MRATYPSVIILEEVITLFGESPHHAVLLSFPFIQIQIFSLATCYDGDNTFEVLIVNKLIDYICQLPRSKYIGGSTFSFIS
jgi:hypothetical protein